MYLLSTFDVYRSFLGLPIFSVLPVCGVTQSFSQNIQPLTLNILFDYQGIQDDCRIDLVVLLILDHRIYEKKTKNTTELVKFVQIK